MRQPWKPIRIHPNAVKTRSRGYLPHWELENATYSITTRLHDSLPFEVAERLRREHDSRVERERLSGNLGAVRKAELELQYSIEVDRYLDRGTGSCILANPEVGRMVLEAVLFFQGQRYALDAACVMPNHVHLVIRPLGEWTLSRIMHSFKRHTSRQANLILGRSGRNWQPEYYDRIVRNSTDLDRTVRYVLENPVKAGLHRWPWIWPP